MMQSSRPKDDEIELSIFGPGRGECIVLHLGFNEWCMIDSCIDPATSLPIGAKYLSSLGEGTLAGVRLVLATHWHDDHIRGLSAALNQFPNATFACSNALRSEEFLKLVGLELDSLQGNSGVDEFGHVYKVLLERNRQSRPRRLVSPGWAIENRCLLQLPVSGQRAFPASLIALSPSDGVVRQAYQQIAKLIPKPGEPQRRIINQSPNSTSVALWVQIGERRVLLGADLEQTQHHGEGWFGVLDSFQQNAKASIIKVPHHGSSNADCPEVWQSLLETEPLAVLTPFSSGRALPQKKDIDRLKERTQSVYCTAPPPVKLPKREKVVEKMLRDRKRKAVSGTLGHIRVRWSVTDKSAGPQIELFEGAYKA
jgi:hypothetical protein